MKTSNKIILLALVATLIALGFYDVMISQTYKAGLFKIPYQGFANIGYKDFDEVDLLSSTAVNAKFFQGPFSVRIDPDALKYTRIHQKGKRLIVEANFKGGYLSNPNAYTLVISCPRLAFLKAGATYITANNVFTDTIVRQEWRMRQTMIIGFQQDSMRVEQDYASTVILDSNYIKSVTAIIGKGVHARSDLMVRNGNIFDKFFLFAGGTSKFYLENSQLKNIIYQQGDSARFELTGVARPMLNNLKNQPK